MEIVQARQVDDELMAAIAGFVRQLEPAAPPLRAGHLERIVESPGGALLVARGGSDENGIVGMLTLAWYPIPTGLHAWIEDVVVDPAARGRGVGEALVRAAIDRARREGATVLDLTSRPEREAANRLYLRIGFQLRNTNVYRFPLEAADS